MNKTNNQETVSKLKKAYSTLAQATNQIIAEEGTPRADKGGWAKSAENEYLMYKKYFNILKDCGNSSDCFKQYRVVNGPKYLNGDDYPYSNWDTNDAFYKLILTDGVQLMFQHASNSCDVSSSGSSDRCASVYVDLNGERKPNQFGRDVFQFALKENGLYPMGCDNLPENQCLKEEGGWDCACKVLREGVINY